MKPYPQIKICGLTRVDEAAGCVERGADAIGLVFFPKSPRHVTDERARDISWAVSGQVKTIGVFVNASYDDIMHKVDYCQLSGVQLHGSETPELVRQLMNNHLVVIKALFVDGSPGLNDADCFPASALLAECSKGPLPGGNAMSWDWGSAKDLGQHHRLILAGGLSCENVMKAICDALPCAVDVSSGVEKEPGRKDLIKVSAFTAAVSKCRDIVPSEKRWSVF